MNSEDKLKFDVCIMDAIYLGRHWMTNKKISAKPTNEEWSLACMLYIERLRVGK